MKKLLLILSTISLVSSSSLTSTIWVNQLAAKHQNLQNWAETNTVNTNEYGAKNVFGVKGFYIRFYMTPAIYNMLCIAALNAKVYNDPAFHFYQFFLGETGKSPIYGTWGQVIKLYDGIIENYNKEFASYGIDFGQLFKNWLIHNWDTFYNILLGYDTTTNNWNFYPFSLDEPSSQNKLEGYWRAKGAILNIPFSLNKNTHTWNINKTNLRIYPQLRGIEPVLYYYQSVLPDKNVKNPEIYVNSPKPGLKRMTVKELFYADRRIINSFWLDLGVPLNLQTTLFNYDLTAYANDYIYRRGEGISRPILINFIVLDDRLRAVRESFPITFWLQ